MWQLIQSTRQACSIEASVSETQNNVHLSITSMPGIAFHSLLDQSVHIGLTAMPAKGWRQGQNACSPSLTAFAAPTLYCPAQVSHVLK